MRVYISGKITGQCRNDYGPKFAAMRLSLAGRGHVPCSPIHDVEHPPKDKHQLVDTQADGYLKRNIKALMDCDAILMLYDWRDSHGATIERDLAVTVGIPVFYDIESLPTRKTDAQQA